MSNINRNFVLYSKIQSREYFKWIFAYHLYDEECDLSIFFIDLVEQYVVISGLEVLQGFRV